MITFRQKLQPHVLIPWVFALVALFGCNLLAQQKASLRKSAQLDGGSVTLLADEDAPPNTANPPTSLAGPTLDGTTLSEPAFQRIAIAPFRNQVALASSNGTVQGRAPPATETC
ncbi:hypothetical protein [Haloferula sp.]|uniref:hypothetical protein n=1 Tax=Haloferula sp. TaxID=2497595 RepID=UPI003C715485